MSNKKRSASSSRWLQEHFSDKYVLQAQKKGLRSRAWFKLDEIQQGDKLFKPGMTVVDLGAAPGGWSQYVATQIGNKGRIIALDLLPMDPIVGVDFLQGDFRDELVLKALLERVGESKVQVVMSDMAPNMSGTPAVDIPKSMYLVELALDMCRDVLAPGAQFPLGHNAVNIGDLPTTCPPERHRFLCVVAKLTQKWGGDGDDIGMDR